MNILRIPPGFSGAGIAVVDVHYSSDPTMTPERVAQLRSRYTSDARFRREMDIQPEALEGELVYPEYDDRKNKCAAFDVSDRERWTIWMALDPHTRTAHAMVWEAFNKHGDRVVCGELWPEFGTRYGPENQREDETEEEKKDRRWRTRDYAAAIQLIESDSQTKNDPFRWARGKRLTVFRRLMDTFGSAANSDEGEDYFETYRRLGNELTRKAVKRNAPSEHVNLNFDPALKGQNNLAKAYDSIASSLRDLRLKVFEECQETRDEFQNMRYPRAKRKQGDDFGLEGVAGRDSDERPVTFQKHALDCLAYIETARPAFVPPRLARSGRKSIYPEMGY